MDQNIVHSVTIKTEPETEEKNITLADFPFICRICLGRGELRFFEEEQCLWDLFVNLTKIEVHSTVDFPKNICIECITKLEDISLFIDVAKDTDFSFGKNVSFIKVEDESLLTIDGGYNNERTRYCCACFSSCNLSSFAEKITLLPIFQEITKIDVGANTKVRNVNSICSRCTNELEKASNFLSLSLSNNELLERLATADTKKEVPNTGDDGSFESITGINDLKVECTDEYTASDIKEEMLDDGLDRGSESSMEADENKPLHTSIDIKQDIIDNEEIIDTEPESSVNNWDQTEIHIKIDKKPKEFQQAEEKPFRCEYCGKGFSQKNHMKHHLLTHTGEKPFKCDYCDKKFSIKFNFERHLLFHTGVKPFKCHYCYKEYTLKYSLRSHLLTHTGERPFKCDHCEQSFIDKRRLQNHLFIHTGERPFKCGDCGESFRTRFILRNHSLSHTGVKPLECEYCCREFGRKYDLKTHLLTHTGEKPFKCDYCDKKFSIKSNFERHLLFHTGVKQFKCHYCYKEYTLKYSLRSHLLTHTGERPFKCDHCEQSFIDKRRLQNHLFIHTGERPFKCGDCGESFRAKFMLRNHSLSHIGVKPLECEYCCREFGRKHDLKNHLLTHTGEKPFKCDHCDKDFSIKSNLKRHLHSH